MAVVYSDFFWVVACALLGVSTTVAAAPESAAGGPGVSPIPTAASTAEPAPTAAPAGASASGVPSTAPPAPSSAPPSPPLSPEAKRFATSATDIRALLAGDLDPAVDAESLFELPPASSDEVIDIEARRLAALLANFETERLATLAPVTAPTPDTSASGQPPSEEVPPEPAAVAPTASGKPKASPVPSAAGSPSPSPSTTASAPPPAAASAPPTEDAPEALAPGEAKALAARLDLDRARLAFYRLPRAERDALLAAHAEKRAKQQATGNARAIDVAVEEARQAEEQQRRALEAAQRASTEAARLVNEEHARLLAITQHQAEFEGALLKQRAALSARAEVQLSWRRRIGEILSSTQASAAASERADATYVELRLHLRQARQALADALAQRGDAQARVPQAGPDPLGELPADVDQTVAVRQRARVASKAVDLSQAQATFETERASQLMDEVEELNRLRLQLLEHLSSTKRDQVLGFGPGGWDQATAEAWQVVLVVRYHVMSTFEWLSAMRSGSAERGKSAWLAFLLLLKLSLPVAALIWWRKHAEGLLEALRRKIHAELMRARDGGSYELRDYADRAIAFFRRVRTPLEWLLLIFAVGWLMPANVRSLLEVKLLRSVLLWTFGGLFSVLAVDALSSGESRTSVSRPSLIPQMASLRLRSLRLIGRVTVGVGVPLSLSSLLVGKGTIYSWVFSTCWFAAIPIILVIVAWWRPFIFERFSTMRKPNRFEEWVLSRRAPPENWVASVVSSAAAVGGGIYLFVSGAVRIVRGRVLTFTLTRRFLAYLFRRDMRKKAESTAAAAYSALPDTAFHALGPEITSSELVPSVADAQVEDLIKTIRRAGGGAIAIVGERGAGKSTLLGRIEKCGDDLLSLTCTADGLVGLQRQLNELLKLAPGAPLEEAAQRIDEGSGDRAVLIDDAHYLVRPMMGGLVEFDRILPLLRDHSKNCSWILAFDSVLWRFVERTRGASPLFDEVIRLRPWSEEAIVRLITQRNKRASVAPDFSDLGFELPPNADDLDRREAARRTESNYYRLLWDYAAGNPGVALHFWRRSLGVMADGVHVKLFQAPDVAQLEALPDSAAFVFRALIQLGWASAEDLSLVTSLPLTDVQDALRFGRQHGYFDMRGTDYRVTWDWFRAVTRFLQRRHLLFSSP